MREKYTPKFDCTRMFASWRETIKCDGKNQSSYCLHESVVVQNGFL